ncbi:MAG: ribonuclease III [Patescibacteria group bacterium]
MNLEQLEKKINYSFNNKSLAHQALVHKSYMKERPRNADITEHNERLEFLGDAVLELVSTEFLYKNFADNEGVLTAVRSALVNAKNLSIIGARINLPENIYLSRGERGDEGKAKEMIVADALEALIGAIYLDGGYSEAEKFINKFIMVGAQDIFSNQSFKDPKTKLQELLQEKHKITPQYEILETYGKDHEKEFLVAVYQEGVKLAEGKGPSKQKAETIAAINALDSLEKK